MNCIICYESRTNMMKFVCSHTICHDCLCKWFDINNTCPMCRCIIKPKLLPNTRGNMLKNKETGLFYLRLFLQYTTTSGVDIDRTISLYEFLNENAYTFFTDPDIVKLIKDNRKKIENIFSAKTILGKRLYYLMNTSLELCFFYEKKLQSC